MQGLSFSFDWIDVQLTDAINNFNLSNIVQTCYDTPGGGSSACDRFQRGTSAVAVNRRGQVLSFGEPTGDGTIASGPAAGFINAGSTNYEGFTAGAQYRIELADWLDGAFAGWLGDEPGRLDLDFDLVRVKRLETSITGLGFDLNRDQGEIGAPQWRWKLDAAYTREALTLAWAMNWIDESRFDNDFTLESAHPLTVDSYFVHDVTMSYDLGAMTSPLGLNNARLRVTIRNLFDKVAPYGAATAPASAGTYDIIGRYFQAGLTARF